MSAPTTPAEMADWLEHYIFEIPEDAEAVSGIIRLPAFRAHRRPGKRQHDAMKRKQK